MFADRRTIAPGTQIYTNICIVGAGAAGIAIAHPLIDSDDKLCLIESGGFEPDGDMKDLYRSDDVSLPYFALDIDRCPRPQRGVA